MRIYRRRIVRTAALGLGLVALAVLAVIPSAAASTPQPTADPALANVDTLAPAKDVDLSSVPKIKTYLRSLGIDPSRAVIQRGARNYAGPNCPGFAWNCTAARGVVVQMAAQSGQNTFECSPVADQAYPTTAPNTCLLVQYNTNGDNEAICREGSDANPVTLTCGITQSNVNGDNYATIDQNVKQVGRATQVASLIADLDQNNDAGNNYANVTQTISQSTSSVDALLMQSQDARFDADVFQDTDSGGDNHLQQRQTLTQDGRASGAPSISQDQFGDHFGHVDQEVGADVPVIDSFLRLAGLGLLQTEGEGFSKAHVTQTERQTLRGPGSQSQDGPMNCCGAGSQSGSPEQTLFKIQQDSTQKASQFDEGNASQFQSLDGSCNTTGTCSIKQSATNEADSLTQEVSGTGILGLRTTCFASEGEGNCFPGGGES